MSLAATSGGLSTNEAAKRLAEEGPNALLGGRRRGWLAILLETLRQPMFLLALSLYLPFLTGVFRFAPLPIDELAVAFVLGLVSVVWFELLKVFHPKKAT